MLGIWSAHAALFLQIFGAGVILLFGLPMVLQPLTWARWLRWRIPEQTHLAIYFGRCLGAIACVLGVMAWSAAAQPAVQPFFFNILAGSTGAMVLVHVWGALRRIQPLTETLEIPFWLALCLLALAFYPAA